MQSMEKLRKMLESTDIKLVTKKQKKKPFCITTLLSYTKCFSENWLAIEMRKINIKINKPVYLGLLLLEISNSLIREFWYDYIQRKYQYNAKLLI